MKVKAGLCAMATAAMVSVCHAGPYEDAFLKCMIFHRSPADNESLMRWITIAYSASPAVRDVVTVAPGAEEEASRAMAAYVNRIFLVDCLPEIKDAFMYEGQTAIGAAFKQLGAIAGREAMLAPETGQVIEGFLKYLDTAAIEAAIGIKSP